MTGRHLDINDRIKIQRGLQEGESLSAIAKAIGVATSTVSREIKANRTRGVPKNRRWNLCEGKRECRKRNVCGGCEIAFCRSCRRVRCWEVCADFAERRCDLLERAPFVCGDCRRRPNCGFLQADYLAVEAQLSHQKRLSSSREGVSLRPEQLESLVCTVRRYLARGWSIEAIWAVCGESLPVSQRTMYSYVEAGLMGLANIDLPKKVRYRPRKKVADYRMADRTDRTYDEFSALPASQRERAVQMDTVVGVRGDFRSILTLHFPASELQLMVMLDEHTCSCVVGALDWIEGIVGTPEFARLFGTVLTDRGIEFCDAEAMEGSCLSHGRRCRVFYCDPRRSQQKGSCERNHALLRRIIPKKTSLDALTPLDVATACSHLNSYPRKSLGGKSPLAAASRLVPKALLDELGVVHLRPDQVVLKPSALSGR